jgi:hypothetical protein
MESLLIEMLATSLFSSAVQYPPFHLLSAKSMALIPLSYHGDLLTLSAYHSSDVLLLILTNHS